MFSAKNKVEQLQSKSSDILGVSTKTVADLNKVNDEANKESSNRRTEAAQLLSEADSLDQVVKDNSRVIGKINSILND